jgi:hypothetical protein
MEGHIECIQKRNSHTVSVGFGGKPKRKEPIRKT